MESTVNRLQLTVILIGLSFIILLILYPVTYNLKPTYAQVQSCGSVTTQPRAEGLVSAKSLTGNFYTSSRACITDERASFVPFEIPYYDELKSFYFTQAEEGVGKITIASDATQANFNLSTNSVVYVSGNLTLSGSIAGTNTGVVFVDGKLEFTANYTGGTNYGTVFVNRGNVVIAPSVNRIDAVIISEGNIYTAGEFCTPNSFSNASQLTINGSLISIGESSAIKFCRDLADNTQPAEIINQQPKYVVILRKIYSEQVRKYTEISADAPPVAPPPATVPPTPTAPPSPTSTPTPVPTAQKWYRDADGDNYGNPSLTTLSITQPAGYVSNNTDCYDSNANAKPGQTSYFATSRGDGSFDYDCSGSDVPEFSTIYTSIPTGGTGKSGPYWVAGYSCLQFGGDSYTSVPANSTSSNSSHCGLSVWKYRGLISLDSEDEDIPCRFVNSGYFVEAQSSLGCR
jgi:hypothetical protein